MTSFSRTTPPKSSRQANSWPIGTAKPSAFDGAGVGGMQSGAVAEFPCEMPA